MQTETLGKLKERVFAGRALKGSILASAFFMLGFLFLPYLIIEASAASDVSAGVRWGSVFLTLDPDKAATDAGTSGIDDEGHGDILFGDLVPTSPSESNYGTMKVVKKTLEITSSGKYYSVYLSTASSNNSLNLRVSDSEVDSGVRIPAVSSSFSSPAKLSTTSWGFAVPGVENTTVEDAPSTFVVPSLLDTQISASTTLDGASATYNSTTWAAVPIQTSAEQIWKAEATGSAGENFGFGTYEKDGTIVVGDTENNHFDIYYAVAVDTNTLAGTYVNEVVYTALASASSLDAVSQNMQADKNFGGAKDIQTLKFDLTESTVMISESDLRIKIVPHSTIVSAGYDISSLNADDYLTCPIVKNSLSFSTYAEVQCKIPTGLNVEDGTGNGAYDFWLTVAGYGYNYVSRDVYNGTTVATFYSTGLQSTYPSTEGKETGAENPTARAGSLIVTKMQEMTNGICDQTNAWGNTVGSNAKVYDYTGSGKVLFAGEPDYSSATITGGGDITIGTFALQDTRDEKYYLVRRLADGNCWMVQNLELNLANFVGKSTDGALTVDNTDLNTEGKTYWDPGESMYNIAKSLDPNVTAEQTSYFPVVSEDKLGVSQNYQFASSATSNQIWNTYYNDISGTKTRLDSPIATSYYAQMPRAYDFPMRAYNYIGGFNEDSTYTIAHASEYAGDYYNFFALSAESGEMEMMKANAEDSICAKGWQLPSDTNGSNKSFSNLICNSYVSGDGVTGLCADENRATASREIGSMPLSIAFAGDYSPLGNGIEFAGHGVYATSSGYGRYQIRRTDFSRGLYIAASTRNDMTYGFSVRCVAHGSELTDDIETDEVVSTCGAGKICYGANGGSGTMNDQSASASANVILKTPTFTRSGYSFAGWSTTENGFGGSTYGPNETITTPSTLGSIGLRLYAKWLPSSGTMQTWTSCSALETHQSVALTDSRDGNTYTVTKLKDGNCWMTTNLALNLDDFIGTDGINSTNSNIGNNDAVNSSLSLCTSEDDCFVSGETTYYWNPETGADDESTPEWSDRTEGTDKAYNWYAAIAGSGARTMESGYAPDSICAKGWRLATGLTGNWSYSGTFNDAYDFENNTTEGTESMRQSPLNFELGSYWAQTQIGAVARQLTVSTNYFHTVLNLGKDTKILIRCIKE